jgi:hypothetical protein
MRLLNILPLAVLGAAIVIPDEQVLANIEIESRKDADTVSEKLPCPHHLLEDVKGWWKTSKKASKDLFDDVLGQFDEPGKPVREGIFEAGFDVESWLESSIESDHPDHPDHDRDDHPGHGPPGHGPPGEWKPPGRGGVSPFKNSCYIPFN